MILSSALKKQLTAFLNGVSNYSGVALCLANDTGQPLLSTNRYPKAHLALLDAAEGCRLTVTAGKSELDLFLFAEREEGFQEPVNVRAVRDLAADAVSRFVKNESEMQALSEELLERYEELHVLYNVIEEVSAVFDEGEICKIILKKAVESLDVATGMVVLMNNERPEVRCKVTDAGSTMERDERAILEQAREVMTTGKHLTVEGTADTGPSMLSVPIAVRDRQIGAIVVMGSAVRRMFTSGDRITLGALAGYLGVALNSARLLAEAREAEGLRREMEFAAQIQQSLLPAHLPTFHRLDVAARCVSSAQVGGDLFAFLQMDKERWAIVVADVAGHGLGAAFIMASLRSILRSEVRSGSCAAGILQTSNNLLDDDTRGNDEYATVFLAVYSEDDHSLSYSNAGHPPALLWRAASKEFLELQEGGTALGLFRDEAYDERNLALGSGDVLVVFTDGIVETKREDGNLYGDDRLRETIKANVGGTAEDVMNAILNSIESFRNGAGQRDDVTLLVFKSR